MSSDAPASPTPGRPESFWQWIADAVSLPGRARSDVEAVLRPLRLGPGEPFAREGGRAPRRVGYVRSGALCHVAASPEKPGGNEHVVGFDFEGDVTGSFESFFDDRPAACRIVALEPTALAVLTREDFETLTQEVPALKDVRAAVAGRLFEGARARANEMQQYAPEERYRRLLARSPRVLRRVPLYRVASYLGVTPEALSRIRRRVADGS